MAKCPVCEWKIQGKGITVECGGKKSVVCCKECADRLANVPPRQTK